MLSNVRWENEDYLQPIWRRVTARDGASIYLQPISVQTFPWAHFSAFAKVISLCGNRLFPIWAHRVEGYHGVKGKQWGTRAHQLRPGMGGRAERKNTLTKLLPIFLLSSLLLNMINVVTLSPTPSPPRLLSSIVDLGIRALEAWLGKKMRFGSQGEDAREMDGMKSIKGFWLKVELTVEKELKVISIMEPSVHWVAQH